MSCLRSEKPHILFLFSDTGGGHRSAAEAIIEATNLAYPGCMTTEMVDFFKAYAPPPFDLAPATYPPMASVPEMWGFGFRISDGRRRTRALVNVLWPYIRKAAYKLIEEHPCDLYVSVHPIVNAPVLRALGPDDPQYITVVTDLVSTHAFWYQHMADKVLVPTERARQRGLMYGLLPDQVEVVGLPVADRFCHLSADRRAIRARLGCPQDLPVILLVGGGDGMGPLEKTAHAIASAGLNAALVIISGHNRRLKARLETSSWPLSTFIYGFVRDMPDFMQAADVLVTKAGPGTISESFIAGLPIIMYSRMPGQEDGNVTYVVDEGAGVWAPTPEEVVDALHNWLNNPASRQKAVDACLRMAMPNAAREIAHQIAQMVGIAELKRV